jgi:phage terminase large subunit GpA-like protein
MTKDTDLRARRPIANVGVDGLKTRIFAKLANDQTIRFSDTLESSYFDQLVSERRIVKYVRGHASFRFEKKPGARNEALDCLVYATAAKSSLGIIVYESLAAALRGAAQALKIPPVIHSAWLKKYRP